MKTWCNEVATSSGVTFYDTINNHVTPADTVWFTVSFTSEFHEGTFCNRGYIESGFITITVAADPGRGDIPAVQAMEKIIPALDAKLDNTQRLVLTSYEPIDEASAGSADKDYRIRVIMNYRYSV